MGQICHVSSAVMVSGRCSLRISRRMPFRSSAIRLPKYSSSRICATSNVRRCRSFSSLPFFINAVVLNLDALPDLVIEEAVSEKDDADKNIHENDIEPVKAA